MIVGVADCLQTHSSSDHPQTQYQTVVRHVLCKRSIKDLVH